VEKEDANMCDAHASRAEEACVVSAERFVADAVLRRWWKHRERLLLGEGRALAEAVADAQTSANDCGRKFPTAWLLN
jgi:hypothetical protein